MVKNICILGGGLAGCILADLLKNEAEKVTIFEKNNYLGGLCQTHKIQGINHEFGPHILFTTKAKQRSYFYKYLQIIHQNYYVRLSIDGELAENSLYDFPISQNNLMRLGEFPAKIKCDNSDNFENYIIRQIGNLAYEKFVKNYNIKQWGINPAEMSKEWAVFRPLKLHKKSPPNMFGLNEAGHPGCYRSFFDKITKRAHIKCNAEVKQIKYNTDKIVQIIFSDYSVLDIKDDDLVINTLPLDLIRGGGENLDWRGVTKIFCVIEGRDKTPSYSTTFPNNYSWTRMVDYNKQSSNFSEDKSLISFAVPHASGEKINIEKISEEIDGFIKDKLKTNVLGDKKVETVDRCYPISNKKNLWKMGEILQKMGKINNFYTIGRLGLYAYISMARTYEMCYALKRQMLENCDKYYFYKKLREELW